MKNISSFKLACLALALQAGYPSISTAATFESRLSIPKLIVSSPSPSPSSSVGGGGTGAVSALLSSNAVNFGSVPSGEIVTAAVLLTNGGTEPLSLTSPYVVSGDSSFFGQTNCPTVLAPSSSCSTTVSFAASGGGTHQGVLIFSTSERQTPYEVSLTGVSLQAVGTLTPSTTTGASNNFGLVPAGGTASLTYVFENSGNTAATVYSTIQNVPGLALSVNNCGTAEAPVTVGEQSACSLTVSWSPVAGENLSNAVLSVAGTFEGAPATLSLSGTSATGSQSGGSAIATLSATALDYGALSLGASSTKSIVLSNTGDALMTINSTPTFSEASGYAAQTNCGSSLNPGASCTTNITFTPLSIKDYPSTLIFSTNSVTNPTSAVSLYGLGQSVLDQLLLTPASLNFGATAKNEKSTAVVALFNTGSSRAALSVGAPQSPYAITGTTCGTFLDSNASCTISVAFQPSDDLNYNSGFSIPLTWGVGAEQTSIPLFGTVLDATVIPSSLAFANGSWGVPSSAQTVQVANIGSAPMVISAIQTSAPFSQTNTCGALPVTLAPGQSCLVSVTYTPTGSAQTGTLTLTNSVTNAPQSVALSGGRAVASVVLNNGTRSWSDGTYATSCYAYYSGDSGHAYTGSTGDGLYKISGGATVYCDMSTGGWTLIGRGTQDINVAGWSVATGDYNVPSTPNPMTTSTWKYSDAFINSIPRAAFRVVALSGYTGTWYAPGSCVYSQVTPATGANNCGKIYSDAALTTLVQTGTGAQNGISDNNGTSSYHLTTSMSGSLSSYGWCAGTGSPGQGGCATAGTRVSMSMWVR